MSTGREWERTLAEWHRAYTRDGRAIVWQTYPPPNLGQSAPPDFLGSVQGVSVAIEAKTTNRRRLAFSAIRECQALDLEAHHRQGGLSILAVKVDGAGYVLPWAELAPMWWEWHTNGGRPASVDLQWLDEHGEPMAADGWISWAESWVVWATTGGEL